MGVPKLRTMRVNKDGSKEQTFIITHADAVIGLADLIRGSNVELGVTSINGQSGTITLPVLSENDYSRIMAMVEAFENGEIGTGSENITAKKVGEVK